MDHKQHSNLSQMPHSNFLLAQPNRFKNNNKRNEVKKNYSQQSSEDLVSIGGDEKQGL